jgi:hypothetical protein
VVYRQYGSRWQSTALAVFSGVLRRPVLPSNVDFNVLQLRPWRLPEVSTRRAWKAFSRCANSR